MSAEILRRAASLMRERATAAPVRPGPWEKEFSDVIRTDVPLGAPGYLIAEVATVPEAEHIASWHPAVALAVADWLEAVAAWDSEGLGWTDRLNRTNWPSMWGDMQVEAIAVARAYLGESS